MTAPHSTYHSGSVAPAPVRIVQTLLLERPHAAGREEKGT